MVEEAKKYFGLVPLNEDTIRFGKPSRTLMPLKSALETCFRKNLVPCVVKENKELVDSSVDDRITIYVDMEPYVSINYYFNLVITLWL